MNSSLWNWLLNKFGKYIVRKFIYKDNSGFNSKNLDRIDVYFQFEQILETSNTKLKIVSNMLVETIIFIIQTEINNDTEITQLTKIGERL